MIGWTAANVLKRLRLSDDQFASIERAAKHSRVVVRWRAVHVMGGFARQSFIDVLLGALDDDPDENVRYGTIRSLLELASRDGDLLPSVVDGIITHLGAILASPRVLSELARAVFLSNGSAPPDWAQQTSRVFYELLERTDDAVEVERWSKLASRVRVHHRSQDSIAA